MSEIEVVNGMSKGDDIGLSVIQARGRGNDGDEGVLHGFDAGEEAVGHDLEVRIESVEDVNEQDAFDGAGGVVGDGDEVGGVGGREEVRLV